MLRSLVRLSLLACAFPLYAQTWEAVSGLQPGDRVQVIDKAGATYNGSLLSVSGEAIRVMSGKNEVSIERRQVRRVKVRSSSRRLRAALIGIGVGFAIGVTVDQTFGTYLRNESGESTGARAVTYLGPIGLIGGIAAAVPAYKTVYRAP